MLCVLRIGRHGVVSAEAVGAVHAQTCVCSSAPLCTEAILLGKNTQPLSVECRETLMNVYVGTLIQRADCPPDCATVSVSCETTKDHKLPRLNTLYGRCSASMEWLDTLYRNYIQERHKFKTKSVAIKAVAGSGKTTTLLQLAKRFKREKRTNPLWTNKSILYVAFNKQLVDDIKHKLRKHELATTLVPLTFDALIKRVAEMRFREKNAHFHLTGSLTPQSLTEQYRWFVGKPYALKKCIIKEFAKFCQDPTAHQPVGSNKWVKQLWEDTTNGSFLTFDGLRKRAHLEHWLRDYLDAKYGLIFVDEAQDFDSIMLDILKHDAKAPKVFVGDPRQQIYEWRGTINAFNNLPESTLMLEFYKTFRMGEPATSDIATLTQTPMISGIPDVCTVLHSPNDTTPLPEKYTYLFRSWKGLLTTSQKLANTLPSHVKFWVYDYDKQMANIERLHERLTSYGPTKISTDEYEDDLPSFLMKLSSHELQAMRDAIESRRVFVKTQAHIQLYTIHSFKGMEADVVRVCGDIDPGEERNLHYVALTRGCTHIFTDTTDDALVGQPNTSSQHHSAKTETASPSRAHHKGPPLPSSNPELVDALRSFRSQEATAQHIPAYRILTNQTMENIAVACPHTTSELLKVNGIGKKKLDEYGDGILSICKRHKKSDAGPRDCPSATPATPATPNTRPTKDTPLLLCYYDLEATGLDTRTDDIIQLAIQYVKYEKGNKTPLHSFNTFVNTTKPIPPHIQAITHITQDDIQTAPYIASVLTTVQCHIYDLCHAHHLGDVVWIAHNGNGFDHKLLLRECNAHGITMLTQREGYVVWYADTLVMARQVFPQCPLAPENNKLQTLYQWCYTRRSPQERCSDDKAVAPLQFHRADADVKAMELVMDTMMELTDDILHKNLQETVQPLRHGHASTKDAVRQTVVSPDVQSRVMCLLGLRDTLAATHNKSATAVMSDALLLQLAHAFPQSLNELLAVKGLTVQKVKLFGTLLLDTAVVHDDEVAISATPTTYEALLQRHKRNGLRGKGFTEAMESQLSQYNTANRFDKPLIPQIAKNAHLKACTGCQSMDGFTTGKLFFGGRKTANGEYVKYCFGCMKDMLCEDSI